ncbi:hypothetical protein [Paenibacillus agilis]|uniref:YqzN/YkzM domain-containing protein n=1 Tax=Paenibacillus agilis TaxID=3020863 RepID=A0A559IXA0_9BACL|nr:hypothetical protein [Paenibacillus agilis]TVX92221.1 hypothetical protein FPZ44_03600 [Paenibacillus agilis]
MAEKAEKKELAVEVKNDPVDFIAGAETFGTTPELMAGALYGHTEPLTRKEAQQALEAFLTKEVEK